MKDIIKVQVPLHTTGYTPMAMIYNRDRSFQALHDITDEIRTRAGTMHKFYCEADIGVDKAGVPYVIMSPDNLQNPGW